MIINGNGGTALNSLIETTLTLDANHYFYVDGHINYLEIPDVVLRTGKLNAVLIYLDTETSQLSDGALYHLYKTDSDYSNGSVTICGRFSYKNNGVVGSSAPFYPSDSSGFVYDEAEQKLKIFIGVYNQSVYMQANLAYRIVIW